MQGNMQPCQMKTAATRKREPFSGLRSEPRMELGRSKWLIGGVGKSREEAVLLLSAGCSEAGRRRPWGHMSAVAVVGHV